MTHPNALFAHQALRKLARIAIGIALAATAAQVAAFLRAVPNPEKPAPSSASPPKSQEQRPAVRGGEEQAEQNRYYDAANPGFAALQKANEALAGFPVDRQGNVDWMAALAKGQIKPLADLHGKSEIQPLDLDVVMTNTREMPHVRFPHRSHTLWLDCSNCHPTIFEPKAGANRISMGEIFRGRYCGVCHDRVAFITYFSCDRCHAVPHGTPDGHQGP